MRRLCIVFAVLFGLSGPVSAHPHTVIDVGLDFLFNDDGALSAVRITWVYDAHYSRSVLQMKGLNEGAPTTLSPEHLASLNGFDMNWPEGFDGHLQLLSGGKIIVLSGPVEHSVAFRGGRIFSTHLRQLETPVNVADNPVALRTRDPGLFAIYALPFEADVFGRDGCRALRQPVDLTAQTATLEAAITKAAPYGRLQGDVGAMPGAGATEEIRLSCAAP